MTRVAVGLWLVLMVLAAFAHGRATHRWEGIQPATSFSSEAHAMNIRVGDFEPTPVPNDLPIKERSICTTKRYDSTTAGVTMMVSLTSGIPGAVSTHTPDVCYVSSGYKLVKGPVKQTIELPNHTKAEYYSAEFVKTTATGVDRQRVRWAWSTDGVWQAPDRPRFAYLQARELYKLYVVNAVTEESPPQDTETVAAFVVAAFTQTASVIAR